MSVVSGKRMLSNLEVIHNMYKIREELTNWLLLDFSIKPPKCFLNIEFNKKDTDELSVNEKFRLQQYENFRNWFINYMREAVIEDIRMVITNLTIANSIYPITIAELEERRNYQDTALGYCSNLLQEFQYIAETFEVNLNKFTIIVDMIDKEIKLIKGWRKSDNKRKDAILKKTNK